MKGIFGTVCTLVTAVFLTSCSSITPEESSPAEVTDGRVTKKCDNPPCGGSGGDGLQPANVSVGVGDFNPVDGAITDPDGAIRIGTDYDVGMDFVDGSMRGTSTSCPQVSFGIIEVGLKRGELAEVIVWGAAANGDQVTSGKQPVPEPAAPTPNVDFTFHVHLDQIPITKGRGKSAEFVCSISIGDLIYDFL
ncbi:MAG: hypothetical protein KJO98_09445 [Rhodothermia bacterium]|nr:hypothetical protein [Rhodothermia bacterium]